MAEHAGVGELVLIDRMRQRHKDGRPADRGQFGNRRSAGSGHDEMARRDARRQIGKERRNLRSNRKACISLTDAPKILLACLLNNAQARPQSGFEPRDCRGHDVGHDARALAAAEYQNAQYVGRRAVRCCRGRDHRGSDRISGERRLGRQIRHVAEGLRKSRGDGGDARRQKPVGASDDRVGVVDHGWNPAPRRSEHRRHARVAAKADHGRRMQPADQPPSLQQAHSERGCRLRQRDGITRPNCRAGDDMDGLFRERFAKSYGATVGREMDCDTAFGERAGQRRRRK
jgi:hypothetical protein